MNVGGILRNMGIFFEIDVLIGYLIFDVSGNDVFGVVFGFNLLLVNFD